MEVRSFNNELGVSNLLFKRLFNNIVIEKVDAKGNKKDVVVKCELGQRSRILKSWQNSERKAVLKLPMIVINRTGYSRDASRVNNLHNEVKYEITSKRRIYDYLTPVPISISYEVSILSKYQKDIDQIASNFMVFFNSSLYVSCVHPKFDEIKMNNQVIMEDNVTEDHPDEIDGATDDLITSTFNFTFKTFLFGGMKQAKKIAPKILSTEISTYTGLKVIEFGSDAEVLAYLSANPHNKLSTSVMSQITAEVTSYVDNPELSDYVYDDFAPIINQIDVGFYPVPYVSSIADHVKAVDTYPDEIAKVSGYISSSSYVSSYVDNDKAKGLSALTPEDMAYEEVDTSGSVYPYVDRLIWRIDAASPNEFPDNIYVYRKNSEMI